MKTYAFHTGLCTVPDCKTLVSAKVATNGGLAVCDAYDYSGLSADGDLICADHFCSSCGLWHDTPAGYDRCANPPMLPSCDRAMALAVLREYGIVR